MREYIRARHLAITYGKKTEMAPLDKDWLVLDTLPDILHTGHLHKNPELLGSERQLLVGCRNQHGRR